jgi:hypothetical protein
MHFLGVCGIVGQDALQARRRQHNLLILEPLLTPPPHGIDAYFLQYESFYKWSAVKKFMVGL